MVSPEDFGSTNPGSIPGTLVKGDVCHVTFYLTDSLLIACEVSRLLILSQFNQC